MPEEILPVYDPYEQDGRAPNLLYLNTLPEKPWWDDRAELRIPVLVTEPVGLERANSPICIVCSIPPNMLPASIRVVTPYGEEVCSQVRPLDKPKNSVEVVFLLPLMKFEQVPLFITFSGKEMGAADTSAPPAFAARLGRDFVQLENERLRVGLDKESGEVRSLVPVGGSERNHLGQYFSFCGGDGNTGSLGGKPEIAEDGPVRKTIRYTHANMRTEYSLYRSSDLLYYRLVPEPPAGAQSMVIWAPYGDCLADHLYYETSEEYFIQGQGIKRAIIRYRVSGDLKDYRFPDLKEGWLAYEDARGEVAGELFDIENTRGLSLYQHGTGYRVGRSYVLGREHRGVLITARGDFGLVELTRFVGVVGSSPLSR
jgi:hypothetical protein